MKENDFVDMARSVMSDSSSGNQSFTDIIQFILDVLRKALGLEPNNANAEDDSVKKDEIPGIIHDWFYPIAQDTAGPGDLVSYLDSANRETLGLIESYDPGTKSGKIFAMDESKGEISSLHFSEGDLQDVSFLRPDIELLMGNLARVFSEMDDGYNEDEFMESSFYPSPSP